MRFICVRKQPIIALYFESENELQFYYLEARTSSQSDQSLGCPYEEILSTHTAHSEDSDQTGRSLRFAYTHLIGLVMSRNGSVTVSLEFRDYAEMIQSNIKYNKGIK